MKKAFLLLALLMGVMAWPNNPYRRYDVRSGLSENSVRGIVQDSLGYMWFATKDGLNRFDGQNFKVFGPSSDGNERGYINCVTLCLARDNQHIWVATTDELLLFDILTEKFQPFKATTHDGSRVNYAFSLCYDRSDMLWIGTEQGLFSWDAKHNRLRRYLHTSSPNSLPSSHIWVVCVDADGTLWVGTRGGLCRYNPHSDDFTPFLSSSHDNEITSITDGLSDNLWVGTWSSGLADFDKKTGSFRYYFSEGSRDAISRIRTVFRLNADKYFIGSDDGLYIFESHAKSCKIVENDLAHESVYTCFRDREGGIWIGTYFSGASYISPKYNDIEYYYDDNRVGSLSGNAVSQFCEDEKGNMWIATENGGLNYFDTRIRRFKQYPQSYNNIHALLLDGDELWIGTFSRGIDIMNTRSGNIRNLRYRNGDPHSLPNDHVYSFWKSSTGEIYVGTLKGCCVYNRKSSNFNVLERLSSTFIYDIREDPVGNIWLADKGGGLWRYQPKTGSLKNFRHNPSDSTSIVSNWVIGLCIDSHGNLWCSTEGSGISRFDAGRECFVNYTCKDNLPNGVIYGILDDGMGNLWLTSNVGMIKYDYKHRLSQVFTYEDGLQSNQFNFRSAYRARNGKLYVGGINGFNAFYPFKISTNQVKPNVALSYIEFPSQNITQPIPETGCITVPYRKANFEIRFAALSYAVPSKNRFAYRLDKINTEWVYTNQNKVSFFGLPSGHYLLRVRACNNDGYWSENEACLQIDILPPWWRCAVAKIIYLLLTIALLWWAYRLYMRRLQLQKQREMQEIGLRKEQELYQSKMMFYTQIAHEIKTPVSLIKAPLEAIAEEGGHTAETTDNLDLIRRNTNRLMELIRQLLDLRKVDADGYKLSFSEVNLSMLIEELAEGFRSAASECGINISANVHKAPLNCYVDRDAVVKMVDNLLSNALKYAVSQISITLSEDAARNVVQISVWDDGMPIPTEERENVFKPFYQISGSKGQGIGIGLSLVKLLCNKHGGDIWFNMECCQGCEAVIELPRIDAVAGQTPASTVESMPEPVEIRQDESTATSILIVDDSPDMTGFLTKNLGHYRVFTVPDGEAALDFLQRTSVDLIVSDIVMPRMDGFELLRRVRADEILCYLPFVLLSARNGIDSKIAGLEYGADAYVEKPFSLNHLRATIDNLLETRRKLFQRFASTPETTLDKVGGTAGTEWIDHINRIIDQHMDDENFSVDTLSYEMSISRSNLQRKMKGLTGMTPNDYIRLIRLKKASQLLREGQYRISEVCYLAGFNNPSYFTYCFQKQFGLSPKEYAHKK